MHELEHQMLGASMRSKIEQLMAIPMVTGFERAQSMKVRDLFAPLCDEIEVDRFGNVIGVLRSGKPQAKTLLLDAHIDQIGFVVTEVLDNGFLRFRSVGGVDPRMLLGAEVTIGAPNESLYGIVSCLPPHLLGAGEADKALPIHKMCIDTGLLDAKSVIPIGTPIWFPADAAHMREFPKTPLQVPV